MSRLVFIEGPLRRREVDLGTAERLTIGRERGNDIVIPDSSVSRRHAYIERRPDGFHVLDNKSTNGVYVNGNKVEECRLRARDRIELGAAAFMYIEDDMDASDAAEMDRVRRGFSGRYDIVERLGEGSQASVYLATHSLLGRKVALKVLRGGGDSTHAAIDRFVKEARALARMAHPAIVEVFDVGEIAGYTFFALSYLKGGTLDERIKKGGRLPVADVVKVGVQIGSGLAHAHGRGIIHRDVKPANVLFDDDDNSVLADFGVAKILAETRLTATGSMFGTPLYMSPEQFGGKPASELSDLYSLAATLYKALTGRPPFEGETVYVVGHRISSEDAKPPHVLEPSIPLPVSSVVHRALGKDPQGRQASVKAFAEELAAALEEHDRSLRASATTMRMDPSSAAPPRYVVKKKVATGRSSEIFVAQREGIGGFAKPVILKRILPAISSHSQFAARFARSVEQASQLDHPGISKIFDFGQDDGCYYVASELMEGRPLRDVIQHEGRAGSAFTPPFALAAGHRLLSAIAYAHGSGVVHGDMRPENVMVTLDGELKILDFGLALPTQSSELVTDNALSGRLPYTPPERVSGQGVSPASDIYGVGAILFEILCGHPPFRGETRAEILERIVMRGVEPLAKALPKVPPDVARIVDRALARTPADRFANAAEMLLDLERTMGALGAPSSLELAQFLREKVE